MRKSDKKSRRGFDTVFKTQAKVKVWVSWLLSDYHDQLEHKRKQVEEECKERSEQFKNWRWNQVKKELHQELMNNAKASRKIINESTEGE